MKRYKVGIVGLGFGQEVHAPVFQSRTDCEVTAIAGTRSNKASQVAERLGIPRSYSDWRKLLNEESLDVLTIATPPAVQFEIAKEALRRKIALLCEKPLALKREESAELVELAERSQVPAMVDYEFPDIPAWRACRERLTSIGAIHQIDVRWTRQIYLNKTRNSSWKTQTASGGGALHSFVSHVFYYLEWLAGPIVATSCRLSRSPGDDRQDSDSIANLDLQFKSGALAKVVVDTDRPDSAEHTMQIKGSQGAMKLQNLTDDYVDGFTLDGKPEAVSSTDGDGRVAAVSCLANRLIQWCESGVASVPDLQSGHRVQCLIDASLASHRRNGEWTSST
jgi:predicted dehydrogenase